jgi:hypothetical protein
MSTQELFDSDSLINSIHREFDHYLIIYTDPNGNQIVKPYDDDEFGKLKKIASVHVYKKKSGELNYTQQLEHRIKMIEDDLNKFVDFINQENMTDSLDRPTECCGSALTHLDNMKIACDLSDDQSLSWEFFS